MMLDLPEKFKTNIFNRYGQKGKDWLKNLDNLVEKYSKKFQLSDIQLIENLSINLVLFAKSELYGDVVMKIGTPGLTTLTEINVIKLYPSKYMPKCYFSSLEDGVIILEKILPGYSLAHLNDLEERIKVFSEISNHLLTSTNNIKNFPTFEKQFHEKIEYAYKNKVDFSNILWMIDTTNDIYAKIKKKNLPKYILHDDLHHKNILKSQNGWKAIDPHGVIGERVFETSHFIKAELENKDFEDSTFDEIINLVSHYFKEDKQLILESLYINIILKIIWYTKNNYAISTIPYHINICKELLNKMR